MLWLGHRPGAIALIRPLAWELPYALGLALKKKKKDVEKFPAQLQGVPRVRPTVGVSNFCMQISAQTYELFLL